MEEGGKALADASPRGVRSGPLVLSPGGVDAMSKPWVVRPMRLGLPGRRTGEVGLPSDLPARLVALATSLGVLRGPRGSDEPNSPNDEKSEQEAARMIPTLSRYRIPNAAPVSRSMQAIVVLATALTALPVDAQHRVAPDSLRRIQQVEPMHGPPGTEVTVYTENLPIQAAVHLGVGATRTGFEALFTAEQGMWGEVSGTIVIPETAPWDRAVLLVAFDAIFAPIGLSEPFHVTREDGTLRRTGEVTDEGVECLAFRDADGYLYTLIGDTGDLEPGDATVVEGTYVETSICQQGTTIEVRRVLPSPSG